MQRLGLAGEFFRGRSDLFGGGGVLLDHLVELLDGLVHLIGADVLFAAGGADLFHKFGGLLDVGHELRQHLACFLRNFHGVAGERADFGGCRLAALGEFPHLRCYDCEAPAVLARAGGFDCGVEGQKVGLPGDFLHEGDLLGDGLHGLDRAIDSLAARLRVLRRLLGDALGLGCVVGVLLDIGCHLFHGSRGLLGRSPPAR